MSRSYKKNPFWQLSCVRSEAQDKMIWHRRWRRTTKRKLQYHPNLEEYIDTHFKEVSDDRGLSKDGKYFVGTSKGSLKKDIQFFKNIEIPCYTYNKESKQRKRAIYRFWGK